MPRTLSLFAAILLLPPAAALAQGHRPWEHTGEPHAAASPRASIRQAGHTNAASPGHEDANQAPANGPPDGSEARTLGPRGTEQPRRPAATGDQKVPAERNSSTTIVTMLGSLGVVLGLFFLVMWLLRRHLPGGAAPLPSDVLEVLGRGTIGAKQPVHLVRLGDRLLLVASHAEGVETLAEITDPDEVTRLAGICRQAHPQSATAAFRQVFQQVSGQPPRATKAEDRRG